MKKNNIIEIALEFTTIRDAVAYSKGNISIDTKNDDWCWIKCEHWVWGALYLLYQTRESDWKWILGWDIEEYWTLTTLEHMISSK